MVQRASSSGAAVHCSSTRLDLRNAGFGGRIHCASSSGRVRCSCTRCDRRDSGSNTAPAPAVYAAPRAWSRCALTCSRKSSGSCAKLCASRRPSAQWSTRGFSRNGGDCSCQAQRARFQASKAFRLKYLRFTLEVQRAPRKAFAPAVARAVAQTTNVGE